MKSNELVLGTISVLKNDLLCKIAICAGPFFERLCFEMAPVSQKIIFQRRRFFVAKLFISHISAESQPPQRRRRLPQRGRAASRPAPFAGILGAYVGYRATSFQKGTVDVMFMRSGCFDVDTSGMETRTVGTFVWMNSCILNDAC